MIPPVHVILNPAAGGGAGRRARPEIEGELGFLRVPFTIEETERPGHAVELAAAAAASGAGTIVAAGGDGTVHEVVNGLLRVADDRADVTPPALGVVPVGTGNDLVKVVAGSTDRRRAYEVLAAGTIRHFDVGRVEWDGGAEYFINGLGTGVDVEVVRQIRRLPRLPGVLSYLVGLFRALVRFDAIPLRVRMDDEPFEGKVMIIAVGNGCCLGGGFYVCPGAEPDDGSLDVCIVKALNFFQIARVLPRVLRGTHAGMSEVVLRRASTIEIAVEGDSPLFFQVDGELREPARARALHVTLERAVLPVVAAPAPAGAVRPVHGGAA